MKAELLKWVDRLARVRALVIGDLMLDRYVYGRVSRISPEGPIPVLQQSHGRLVLGGSANVARNLAALGVETVFVGAVGQDRAADQVRRLFSKSRRVKAELVTDPTRMTTVKTRFLTEQQQILRVDRETVQSLPETATLQALERIRAHIKGCDVVIISDYGKGFLTDALLKTVIRSSRRFGKPVLVDPKGLDFSRYAGASCITPNQRELGEASRLPVENDKQVIDASLRLIQECRVDAVLATRGEMGMSLVSASGEVSHHRTEAREVFDVSGAGDTVIAAFSVALAAGAPPAEAASLANAAAGIVVGKLGTAVASSRELAEALVARDLSEARLKVCDLTTAVRTVKGWRKQGFRIGFTNGVFDLLHMGHLSLIHQAARQCDRLIVALNGDHSVRQLRGEEPVQDESARSAIIGSLQAVDLVMIYQEETPIRPLKAIRPDILFKGANYSIDEVVGGKFVQSYGGKVVRVNLGGREAENSRIRSVTGGTF